MHSFLTGEQLADALDVAGDPEAADGALRQLPRRHLAVWGTLAQRHRLSSAMRAALLETAMSGVMHATGRKPEETALEFEVRWARTVLAAQWLTRRRLQLLLPALSRSVLRAGSAAGAAAITRSLATHRNADGALVAEYLGEFFGHRAGLPDSPWDGALGALRGLAHPFPVLADVAEHQQTTYGPHDRRVVWPKVGPALAGIDETSARILVGMLATWIGSFPDAVAAARDVAGNPRPEDLATDLTDPVGSAEWQHALRLATDPTTTTAQLKLLPRHHVTIWRHLAGHPHVDAALRKDLWLAALAGPARMRGRPRDLDDAAWVDRWAQVVFAAPWMTAHRLCRLMPVARPRPEVVVPVLAAHPRVNASVLCTYLHHTQRQGRGTYTRALNSLAAAATGRPWPLLAAPLQRREHPGPKPPYWMLDLTPLPSGGRRLDALGLTDPQLERLLSLLPTWGGDLASAVEVSTRTP